MSKDDTVTVACRQTAMSVLTSSSCESADQATLGAARSLNSERTLPLATSTSSSVWRAFSKAIRLPSGDQPKSAITPAAAPPRTSVLLLPPCGETRSSAGQFGFVPRRYAIFVPAGDQSGLSPLRSNRCRWLPSADAVQMPSARKE